MSSMYLLAATLLVSVRNGSQPLLPSRSASSILTQTGFTENRGQWDPATISVAQFPGLDLWVKKEGLLLSFHKEIGKVRKSDLVKVSFVGANPLRLTKVGKALPRDADYFLGRDRRRWATNVRSFEEITVSGVYPGIDMRLYVDIKTRGPRYDFVVHHGADPKQIQVRYDGMLNLHGDQDGNLDLITRHGRVAERDLRVFQSSSGFRKRVPAFRSISRTGIVTFKVGAYDRSRDLVIDPLISSTYFGGSGKVEINQIKQDFFTANAYFVGDTTSLDLPGAAGSYMPANPATSAPNTAAFVGVLAFDHVHTTYFGGNLGSRGPVTKGFGLTLDYSNRAYQPAVLISGVTNCTDLPTTSGAFQPTFAGNRDGFIAKFNTDLSSLVACTYLGGSGEDLATSTAVDNTGNVTVAGIAGVPSGSPFPTSSGAFQVGPQGGKNDCFVASLTSDLSSLRYSTLLGGNQDEFIGSADFDDRSFPKVLLDSGNHPCLIASTLSTNFPTTAGVLSNRPGRAGKSDIVLSKLSADGSSLIFGTYLGGVDATRPSMTSGYDGNFVVAGQTSTSFPTTTGAYRTSRPGGPSDGFVTKISADGVTRLWSTYFGGSSAESVTGVGLTPDQSVVVSGSTQSTNYPTSVTADRVTLGGSLDGFVTKFSPNGSQLVYSSFYGGSDSDSVDALAVGVNGDVLIAGKTASADFPVTSSAFQSTNPSSAGLSGFVTDLLSGLAGSVSLTPYSVIGGNPMMGRVSIYGTAHRAIAFNLSSTSTNLRLPSRVTIPVGSSSVDFPVTTTPVNLMTYANVSATLGTEVLRGTTTVTPPNQIQVVGRSTTFVGGSTATPNIQTILNGRAGSLGIDVSYTSDNGSFVPPLFSHIPSGGLTTTIFPTHGRVSDTTIVNCIASTGYASGNVSFKILPFLPSSFTTDTTTLHQGSTAHLTLRLSATPLADLSVTTTTRGPLVVPGTVTVARLTNSVTFDVTPSSVTSPQTGAVSITLNGVTRVISIRVLP